MSNASLRSGRLGGSPLLQKSHDAKNKNPVETIQGSLDFPTWCEAITSFLSHPGRDPGPCSRAVYSARCSIKLEMFEEGRCILTRDSRGRVHTALSYQSPFLSTTCQTIIIGQPKLQIMTRKGPPFCFCSHPHDSWVCVRRTFWPQALQCETMMHWSKWHFSYA